MSETLPIWARDEAFPRVPVDSATWGYIDRKGRAVACDSFVELYQAIEEDSSAGIGFIWTPELDYLITPEEVDGLFPAVKKFRLAASHDDFLDARRNVFIFLGLLLWILLANLPLTFEGLLSNQIFGFSLILFVMLGLMPLYQALKEKKRARELTPERMAADVPAVRFEIWLARQKGRVTRLLCAGMLAVGVAQLWSSLATKDLAEIINKAGLLKPYTGEYWRLLTAPFIHGGVLHFVFNFMALRYLGRRVEALAGWSHLISCLVASMIFGGVCSLLFVTAPSVGISGGICGLLGLLLLFEINHQKLVPRSARRRLAGAIMGLVIIGLMGYQFIDNAAHLGGLVAGLGYAWVAFPKSNSPLRPKSGVTASLVGGVSAFIFLMAVGLTIRLIF